MESDCTEYERIFYYHFHLSSPEDYPPITKNVAEYIKWGSMQTISKEPSKIPADFDHSKVASTIHQVLQIIYFRL